jgi:aspartyl-tRNA(Asn)/glutamyl-tRNA(Gln) amidotransferase subunit B
MRVTRDVAIGFEVHAQLATATKIFCACANEPGGMPNSRVCPVCLGLPGALPVLNREAVELGIRVALALGSDITTRSSFARKNYFYPDLPKGYQITQHRTTLASGGHVELDIGGTRKRVRIRDIHIEEDAGKTVHTSRVGGASDSGPAGLVDMNRCGVPLVEIVSDPDISSPEEADAYLRKIHQILIYLGVTAGELHQGNVRFDTNVSIRNDVDGSLGTPCEIKNLNSFKAVGKALSFEIERQRRILQAGGTIEHETLLWDDRAERALPMRSKEEASDYRYFPEPDLGDIVIGSDWIEFVRRFMPEPPDKHALRFRNWYGLRDDTARVLTAEPATAIYFEDTLANLLHLLDVVPDRIVDPAARLLSIPFKTREKMSVVFSEMEGISPERLPELAEVTANWVTVMVGAWINENGVDLKTLALSCLPASRLAQVIAARVRGTVNEPAAKRLLVAAIDSSESVEELLERLDLTQVTDSAAIQTLVADVLSEHPAEVERLRAGEEKLLRFLVGQVMKRSGGKADPALVNKILVRLLGIE